MTSTRIIRGAMRAACASALLAGIAQAQGVACAGKPSCEEVTSFVATVTDFRTSVSGRYRIVATTIRFRNKLDRPLTLGYVPRSGIATDDRGNRYEIGSNAGVRGIGVVSSGALDVKFVLQPGESSDARFEFGWQPGHEIYGSSYQVELAIREIDQVAPHQYTLGKEHALRFSGFGTPPAVAATAPAAAPTTPVPVAPMADPCDGKPRCYASGPFVAEVSRFTGSRVGNRKDHALSIGLKFRNVSAQPIILAYHTGSSTVTDNLGNRYYWGHAGTHDMSASGIGIVEGSRADPQFVLQPGESREAKFGLIRYNTGNQEIGTTFSYDVVIDQLELPQWRSDTVASQLQRWLPRCAPLRYHLHRCERRPDQPSDRGTQEKAGGQAEVNRSAVPGNDRFRNAHPNWKLWGTKSG